MAFEQPIRNYGFDDFGISLFRCRNQFAPIVFLQGFGQYDI